MISKTNDTRYFLLIALLSVAVPLLVTFLPKLHAMLNSLTAIALVLGFTFIRKGNIRYHRFAMVTAIVLSAFFLISYVTYHYQAPPTRFGGEGTIRGIYYFVLLTHIVLAAVIVPLVLLSVYFAISNQFDRHRRIARWTLPIWLYVAITGVVVYFMISPYYT